MNTNSFRFRKAAVIFAAGACLVACASKPRERSVAGIQGPGVESYESDGAGTGSTNLYRSNSGTGGTGTMLLDTVYQSDSLRNRSDSARPGTDGNPGTGLPGMQRGGGSGMDSMRGSDSLYRNGGTGMPEAYPGTGAPGSHREGGSGQGGTGDSLNLDKINDSLGVLDWHERG